MEEDSLVWEGKRNEGNPGRRIGRRRKKNILQKEEGFNVSLKEKGESNRGEDSLG